MDLNDKTAKKLKFTVDGCTETTEYECACGKGKIIYVRECGFGDYYAKMECDACEKEYIIQTACGHKWELIKNNK